MGTFGGYSGSKKIPEDKKEIFSQQMLKILNYGGMMNFEAIQLYGKEMGLLKPIEIKTREDVWFHYNYFEDNFWETAGFKVDSCRLWSEKIGCAEFNDVIMAGYTLYEAYCDEEGMANVDGEIIDATEYMGWINHILGTFFSLKNRFNMWKNVETYALSRIEAGYADCFSERIFSKIIPKELEYAADETELADLYHIVNGTSDLIDGKAKIRQGSYYEDVLKCRQLLENYFDGNIENPLVKLWDFLKLEYKQREKESDSCLKEIAKMSLRISARVFVYLAIELDGNMEFWKEWKELKDIVYQDEHMKNYVPQEVMQWKKEQQENPVAPIPTSRFLHQEESFVFYMPPKEFIGETECYISDDDRLYWWDGSDEVKISAKTEQWLKDLAKQHKKMEETKEYKEAEQDFQKFLWTTIVEIEDYYKRVYPFQKMFYEFMQNGNKKEYIAAVALLKRLADSEEYRKTGEIVKYARRWEMSGRIMTHNIARIRLKRYLSVMANKKIREIYFGF